MSFEEIDTQKAEILKGDKWNYIYLCTVKALGILHVKNALVRSVSYVTENTVCSLVTASSTATSGTRRAMWTDWLTDTDQLIKINKQCMEMVDDMALSKTAENCNMLVFCSTVIT
jgi:hypothetical protein